MILSEKDEEEIDRLAYYPKDDMSFSCNNAFIQQEGLRQATAKH